MDITLSGLVKLVTELGPLGLVIFFWWYDNRRIWIVFDQHKRELESARKEAAADITMIMTQYRKDMEEQREMYRANSSLCRDFSSVAGDLRDIVSLNIQAMTQVKDAVEKNQYCPMVRIDQRKFQRFVNAEGERAAKEAGG